MLERFNSFMKCTWHIDFVGAIVCGFCLGAWTERVRDDEGFVLRHFIWYVSLNVVSFAIAAIVLMKWRGKWRCAIGWLAVLLLGSALSFFSVGLVGSVNYGKRVMGETWLSYVIERFVEWTLAGAILMLPVMLMVRILYIVIRHWRQRMPA